MTGRSDGPHRQSDEEEREERDRRHRQRRPVPGGFVHHVERQQRVDRPHPADRGQVPGLPVGSLPEVRSRVRVRDQGVVDPAGLDCPLPLSRPASAQHDGAQHGGGDDQDDRPAQRPEEHRNLAAEHDDESRRHPGDHRREEPLLPAGASLDRGLVGGVRRSGHGCSSGTPAYGGSASQRSARARSRRPRIGPGLPARSGAPPEARWSGPSTAWRPRGRPRRGRREGTHEPQPGGVPHCLPRRAGGRLPPLGARRAPRTPAAPPAPSPRSR